MSDLVFKGCTVEIDIIDSRYRNLWVHYDTEKDTVELGLASKYEGGNLQLTSDEVEALIVALQSSIGAGY